MNTILRLEYKREYFDLELMKIGAKKIVTITDDGMIVSKEYVAGSRKVRSVQKERCTLKAYEILCKCKCQYKNVGFIQNNYVGKPTFLFCIFSLRSSVRCCI